jgi:hypothetical protein
MKNKNIDSSFQHQAGTSAKTMESFAKAYRQSTTSLAIFVKLVTEKLVLCDLNEI